MSKNPTFPFVISCYLNNVLYKLSECDEYFGCVNGVSVAKGDFGIRNAGAVFVHNGNIIRPGQDCRSGIYGAGLVFFSIKSFLPYKEELFKSIQACELQKHLKNHNGINLYGCHTYNSTSKYEVVDISYFDKLPYLYKLKNKVYIILCFVSRVFRYLLRMHK
jgi:hypothetical protein